MEDTRAGTLPPGASIDELISNAAAQYNIDPKILRNLLMQESSLNPNAPRGAQGEVGMGQFMPATAAALGIDPSKPEQAIPGAALYLRQNLNRFGNDYGQAVAAYNWGPGNLSKYGLANAPASVRNYVSKVTGSAIPGPVGLGSPGAPGAPPGTSSPAAGAIGGNAPLGAPNAATATSQNGLGLNPAMALQALQPAGTGLGAMMANAAAGWQQNMARTAGLG